MSHDTTNNHNDENHIDESHYHGTYRSYIIGFVLSVILTAIPFAIVMNDMIDDKLLNAVTLLGFAAVQMVVHMIYFLHMNGKSEDGWNIMAFGFTLIIVVIALSGSIWVMHHLNTNMMPDHEMEASF